MNLKRHNCSLSLPVKSATSPGWRTVTPFALILLLLAAASTLAEDVDVFHARQLWTGDGPPIEEAALVVKDGKIVAVGPRSEVASPANAREHQLGDAVLIPGLVAAESQLASGSRDDTESLAPHLRAIDGFDFFDDYHRYLAGGVTSVQVSPGGARLAPGQGGVVKLAGDDVERRVLSEMESLRIILSQAARNPPTVFKPTVGAVSVDKPLEPTNPQLAKSLAGAVSGLRAMFRASQAEAGDSNQLVATVARYRKSRRTIRITATTAAEVRASLLLAREFDLRILLVDAKELEPLERQLARVANRLLGVVLNAEVRPGQIANPPVPSVKAKQETLPWDNARTLLDRKVKVAIRAARDSDLSELLFLGGLFQQGGLSEQEILRAITLTPAELLGVSKRVGSLAVGKDADFVVLSGGPFSTRTQVRQTYVDGKRVYDNQEKKRVTVIRAGEIHDGLGRVVKDGGVVVEAGKIRGLGSDVSAPLDADVRSFPGAVVVPGFIDLGTGLGGPLTGSVSVQTKLGEQLDSADPAITIARQGGVTTVLLSSTSSSPSPVVAFKLNGKARVVRDPVALRFSITGNLSSTVPSLKRTLTSAKAYSDSWTKYDAAMVEYNKQLKIYEAAKAKFDAAAKAAAAKKKAEEDKKKAEEAKKASEKKPTEKKAEVKKPEVKKADDKPAEGKKSEEEKKTAKPEEKVDPKASESKTASAPTKPKEPTKPKSNAGLEPYRALFANKIPAFVVANNVNELRAATKLFRDEFELRTVFIGANDAMRAADLLSDKDVGVAVGPSMVRTVERRVVNTAQVLANHQIPFGFLSQATTGVRLLPQAVQFAVRKGLGAQDALKGLTQAPAKLLSLESQIGSLAAGRDADLVVLSGPPFELSTKVIAVMIDGEWVYEQELNK